MMHRDSGRISVLFAIAMIAILIVIGAAVDGGGVTNAQQRADNIAAEAARAGGQAINATQAITGGAKVLDPVAAKAAVKAYLDAAGVTGTTTIIDSLHLRVTVTLIYESVMLGMVGHGKFRVTGEATAQLVTT
jgi:Flp pilus assembly protein TadG